MTENTTTLQANQGTLTKRNGKPVAIYKDDTGGIHEMSAVCTHAGCTVGWNDSEKTWDCPCHGSRFDAHGKVIHGPAVQDLPPVQG